MNGIPNVLAVDGALPEGLPSWLIVVLFVLFGSPALFSQMAAKIPGVGGALGRWWQRRREPEIRREASIAASYRVQEAEISRLSEQYQRLSDDWAEQNKRLDHVEDRLSSAHERLTDTNRKFFALVQYARDLVMDLRRVDPQHVVREPPEVLKEFL